MRFGLVVLALTLGATVAALAALWSTDPASAQTGADWTQLGADIDGVDRDESGESVAMSADGNTVIIGATTTGAGTNGSGRSRVFRFDGTDWAQLGTDIDGERARDFSGRSVSMSADGNTVIIGALANDVNGTLSGHARVFQFDGTDWTQVGTDIDGEAAGDQSGDAVAISANGNTVIIGAPFNDGTGTDVGHARIFQFDGTDWTQVGTDIDGEARFDQSGDAVAISADGNTVIIGAPQNDARPGVAFSGHARVYRLPPPPMCNGLTVTVDLNLGQSPTAFDDVILGTPLPDTINGGAGNDTICGEGGPDTINGGSGNDTILGGNGTDQINGGAGADTLMGENGADQINGGAGADTILGGDGDDDLRGQGGDDTLMGENGTDQFFGGSGRDTIDTGVGGNAGTAQVIAGQSGADTIFGSPQADIIEGGPGQDEIHGGNGDDVLNGGRSGDTLFGDTGNDQLFGGPDRDTLNGGPGTDSCNGGGATNDIAAPTCETTLLVP